MISMVPSSWEAHHTYAYFTLVQELVLVHQGNSGRQDRDRKGQEGKTEGQIKRVFRPLPTSSSLMTTLWHCHQVLADWFNCNICITLSSRQTIFVYTLSSLQTIFEINSTTKTTSKSVMLSKRQKHGKYIEKARQTAEEREEEADKMPIRHISDLSANAEVRNYYI